ncbi:MAG: methyltransferase [Pseudonocardia sp.]|jgi:release factor glutamine methyltransferase
MLMFCPPGTYRAQTDTELLIEVLRREGWAAGRSVLDLCSGPGTVALAAAAAGARSVTAVELSRRSAAAAWLNARSRRLPVAVRRGDLFGPVRGRRFDLVTVNPPYVPSPSARLARYRAARSWDGGTDGRAVLDRVCVGLATHLAPDGRVLLVHSGVCDPDLTITRLADVGVRAEVLMRTEVPYGPVMRGRSDLLECRGLTAVGARTENLVVIGGQRGG